jgi:circadian clock protein KaiC
MEYVTTSIEGFDNMFSNKGYPRGNSILVIGGPGSGKSIFAMQFICGGAQTHGELGIYVTLDEIPERLKRNVAPFGWDADALEDEKKIIIIDALLGTGLTSDRTMEVGGLNIDATISHIITAIKEIGATRLVIDSLSIMNLYADSEAQTRANMLRLSAALSGINVTSLIITDAKTNNVGINEFPQEAFVFDGVITLNLDANSQERRISIRKMRGTKHIVGSFRFDISESGISVAP